MSHQGKLPVIVYIHGGAFLISSSGGHGPDIILNEDVVLVTINYRLGPYGFLSLDTADYSGNMGLKDQLMALKWVRENIAYFGGDPEKVTLYGHSAGAVAVHLHVLSPKSNGYFKRAIMSSASALVPWAYGYVNHTNIVKDMMHKIKGISVDSIGYTEIVEWLKNVDTEILGMESLKQFYVGGERKKLIDFLWLPRVECKRMFSNYAKIMTFSL